MDPELRVTGAAYDAVAEDYASLLQDELAGKPLDRALLGAFLSPDLLATAVAELARVEPDLVAALLTDAGLAVTARTAREPAGWERTPQDHLPAHRPA